MQYVGGFYSIFTRWGLPRNEINLAAEFVDVVSFTAFCGVNFASPFHFGSHKDQATLKLTTYC